MKVVGYIALTLAGLFVLFAMVVCLHNTAPRVWHCVWSNIWVSADEETADQDCCDDAGQPQVPSTPSSTSPANNRTTNSNAVYNEDNQDNAAGHSAHRAAPRQPGSHI